MVANKCQTQNKLPTWQWHRTASRNSYRGVDCQQAQTPLLCHPAFCHPPMPPRSHTDKRRGRLCRDHPTTKNFINSSRSTVVYWWIFVAKNQGYYYDCQGQTLCFTIAHLFSLQPCTNYCTIFQYYITFGGSSSFIQSGGHKTK